MDREQRQSNSRGNGSSGGYQRYNRHRGGARQKANRVDSDQQNGEQSGNVGTATASGNGTADQAGIAVSEGPSRVMLTLAELESRNMDDLAEMAKELDISGISRLKKQDLAFRILQAQT